MSLLQKAAISEGGQCAPCWCRQQRLEHPLRFGRSMMGQTDPMKARHSLFEIRHAQQLAIALCERALLCQYECLCRLVTVDY